MTCFPCQVVKREVEMRLADAGASPAQIVAQKEATLCLMCAMERAQSPSAAPAPAPAADA